MSAPTLVSSASKSSRCLIPRVAIHDSSAWRRRSLAPLRTSQQVESDLKRVNRLFGELEIVAEADKPPMGSEPLRLQRIRSIRGISGCFMRFPSTPLRFTQDDRLLQLSTILPEFPDFISSIASLNCVYGKRCVITGEISRPLWIMAVILYQVSYISRP
jgi:hypothetical protein